MSKISRSSLLGYGGFCLLILLLPIALGGNSYLLNKASLYMALAIATVALSFTWGYVGILNLGQAVSFGLGAYAMAMHLKLVASASNPGGLPDFMTWNSVGALPLVWRPFYSLPISVILGIGVSALLAAVVGSFVFRARISGVFVAIITLALLVVVNLVIVTEQGLTGGWNGITNLADLNIGPLDVGSYGLGFYYLVALTLVVVLLLGWYVTRSKTGLVLRAINSNPQRTRYLGYDVAAYETFAYAASAGIASIAGMYYAIGNSFASPTFLDVPFSLSIVIWCAVGGRSSLIAAAIGALIVNTIQGALSSDLLDVANLVIGGLFVVIVLFLPQGIVPEITGYARRVWFAVEGLFRRKRGPHSGPAPGAFNDNLTSRNPHD